MEQLPEHKFWRDGPTTIQRFLFAFLWMVAIVGLIAWGIFVLYERSENLPKLLESAAEELSGDLPKAMSETVEFSAIIASDRELTLKFTIDISDSDAIESVTHLTETDMAVDSCEEKEFQSLFSAGGGIRTVYIASDGEVLSSIVVNREVCERVRQSNPA